MKYLIVLTFILNIYSIKKNGLTWYITVVKVPSKYNQIYGYHN